VEAVERVPALAPGRRRLRHRACAMNEQCECA
jgi:hypothetical protein